MNELSTGDKILKLLQKCNRHRYIPDLHSFKAKIENGVVFVECSGYDAFTIWSITYDKNGEEKRSLWSGPTIEAGSKLELLKIDLNTVEM